MLMPMFVVILQSMGEPVVPCLHVRVKIFGEPGHRNRRLIRPSLSMNR